MIEYLYDAIRATAGQEVTVSARITDNDGAPITEDCHLMLYDDEDMIGMIYGTYSADEDIWAFTIPADATKALKGRYWYCICHKDTNLCFKQPFYLI